MPSLIHLLLLTENVHQVVHRKLGSSRWKKRPVCLSVPVSSQAWTAHCGDRNDPQPVKHSNEWMSEWVHVSQTFDNTGQHVHVTSPFIVVTVNGVHCVSKNAPTLKRYSSKYFCQNVVKIHLYNSELYHFKVGAFFSETQCSSVLWQ